jgi:hypothetical protein
MRLAFDSLMQTLSHFSRHGQTDDPDLLQRSWRPIPNTRFFPFLVPPPAVADVITRLPSQPLGIELQLIVGRPSQGPPAWQPGGSGVMRGPGEVLSAEMELMADRLESAALWMLN